MQVVDVAEMDAPKARVPRKRARPAAAAAVAVEPEPSPSPVVVREFVVEQPAGSLIPMPSTDGFAEDTKFRGITAVMDKVLDALHRDGWSLVRLYSSPLAMLPLPANRFPPNRVYLCTENVAVVVNKTTGSVVTSLPVTAALRTLNQFSPEVLERDPWASARWEEFLEETSPDDVDLAPRWHKQSWFDRNSSVWMVKRVHDGVKVYRDGEVVHLVRDDVEAEDLGLHPITVEMVAFVLEIPSD